MYFLRNVLLIFMILFFCITIYTRFLRKWVTLVQKDYIILVFLCLMNGLLVFFNTSSLFLIFMDLPIFLAYFLKKRNYALILSAINTLYFCLVLNFPVYYYIIYLIYFMVDVLVKKYSKDLLTYFLFIKAFNTSLIYFLYIDNSLITVFSMIFAILYFYFIFAIALNFLEKESFSDKDDDSILFQMAHEVKNPIAVCKGYLDMLDLTKQDKVNKYIPIVRSEMNRSLTIMDDFLNLKRLTVNKDIMDLYMLLEDVEDTLKYTLEDKRVILEVPDIEDELYINGDYERLKQVFVNIIKNSYEAEAVNIMVEVEVVRKSVHIKIIDNGNGISKKDIRKIGDLFFTTKVKGTGIGVSLSREIIKLHGGSLKYESVENDGTTVTIVLPI